MTQQNVLITGANSGIGKEAALLFARNDYTVIMGCRDIEKSLPVKNEIISATGNPDVFLYKIDISDFSSIKTFCDQLKFEFPKLDILIHNAAYFNHGEDYKLSSDGIEIAFATNVVGPFLMTHLLLPLLKNSDDARILNASSNIIKHFFSPGKSLDFNNLQGIKDSSSRQRVYDRYCNSKMAFLMLSFKMSEVFQQWNIKVNSLHINGARMSTETLKKFSFWWRQIARVQNLFFPRPDVMAQNYFDLCTSEEFQTTTGKLFNHKLEIMKPGPENPTMKEIWSSHYYPAYAEREDIKDRVWELCSELTKNISIRYTSSTKDFWQLK